jgi:hypothetical protein
MKLVDHRNCIKLHEVCGLHQVESRLSTFSTCLLRFDRAVCTQVYHSPDHICMVLDLVTGGELFDRIIARGYYSEKDAAEVS